MHESGAPAKTSGRKVDDRVSVCPRRHPRHPITDCRASTATVPASQPILPWPRLSPSGLEAGSHIPLNRRHLPSTVLSCFFFFSLFFFFITYTKTQSPLLGETWPVAMQTVRHMFAAVYRCRNSWALRPAKLPCPLFFLLTSHTRILSLFFSFTPSCEYSFQTRVHHPAPVRLLLGGSPSQLVFSSKINRMHFGSNGSCLFNEQRETLGLCCSLLRGDDLGCDCCLWTWTLMMKSSQRNGVG